MTAMAVPPMPGFLNIPQPDGSTVEARIIGDNEFHYYETRDGEFLVDQKGFLRPATARRVEELKAEYMTAREAQMTRTKAQSRIAPGTIRNDFPTTGELKGLVVLAEFQDVKFQP